MYKKLLNGNEVAALLNISRSQAFTLMQRGDIATVRFGRNVRVCVEDLEQFIEDNRIVNDQSSIKARLAAATASKASSKS